MGDYYYYSLADNKLTLHVMMPEVLQTDGIWDGGAGQWDDLNWNGGGVPDYRGTMAIDGAGSQVDVADQRRAWSAAVGAGAGLAVTAGNALHVTDRASVAGLLNVAGSLNAYNLDLVDTGIANVAGGGQLTVYNALEVAAGGTLNVTGSLAAETFDSSGTKSFASSATAEFGSLVVRGGTTTSPTAGAVARSVAVENGAVFDASGGATVLDRLDLNGKLAASVTGGALGIRGSNLGNQVETLSLQGGTILLIY